MALVRYLIIIIITLILILWRVLTGMGIMIAFISTPVWLLIYFFFFFFSET